MDPRRLTASPLVLALVILACGCSASSSATPTADHHGTTTTGAPRTTTTTSAASATPTTVPVLVPQAPGWSLGLTTLPPGGGFTSLSCISDTFCVAAGGGTTGGGAGLVSGSGVTLSWDGAAWSPPSVYYPAPATGPVAAPALPTITCTSGPLCVIVDGSDHVSTGDGTDWSSPVPIAAPELLPANPADPGVGHPGSRTSAVSCPTPALCAVVDNTGRTFTLRDNSWLAPQSFGTAQGFGATAPKTALYQSGRVGVSCPTLTSCTAVVGSSVLRWDGATWSAEATPWTTSLAPGAGVPVSIACPTVDLCAVVNGDAIVVRHAGGAWTPRQVLDPGRQLDAISCPTRSFCIAADDTGSVMLWNGTTWTGPQPVIPAATQYTGIGVSVSCPNDRFCMIMNADGDYATYTGPGTAPAGP